MSAARIEDIRAKLAIALDPQSLEVMDEGHLHIGHAGEGSGHFRVRIISDAFAGKNAIQRHRALKVVRQRLLKYNGATPTAYVLTRVR